MTALKELKHYSIWLFATSDENRQKLFKLKKLESSGTDYNLNMKLNRNSNVKQYSCKYSNQSIVIHQSMQSLQDLIEVLADNHESHLRLQTLRVFLNSTSLLSSLQRLLFKK